MTRAARHPAAATTPRLREARLDDRAARMWTAPDVRRHGHGRRVPAALEHAAPAPGYTVVRLQTADVMSAAPAL
jgi:GNAT superfamily N-acetyltransferase